MHIFFDFLVETSSSSAAEASDVIYKRFGAAGCAITLLLIAAPIALILWTLGAFSR